MSTNSAVALANAVPAPRQVTTKDRNLLRVELGALDLSMIKFKLQDPEEGQGWTAEYCDQVEKVYKNFLFLVVTSSAPTVPTKAVDAFWHQHILDTRKYAEDCDKLFGFFLHHFPYFGRRGQEDKENFLKAGEETAKRYQETFGEDYRAAVHDSGMSSCESSNCSGCDSGCY